MGSLRLGTRCKPSVTTPQRRKYASTAAATKPRHAPSSDWRAAALRMSAGEVIQYLRYAGSPRAQIIWFCREKINQGGGEFNNDSNKE